MSAAPPSTLQVLESALTQQIAQALKNLRYGSVEIIVHDGRIVQIERREKLRFDNGHPDHKR
jgi:hypothetical protein